MAHDPSADMADDPSDDMAVETFDGIPRTIRLDAQQLTTLAHPLRSRLLTALRQYGPATATALAQRLGTNSGTTSYHLRKLAEVGLVTDAPDEGDGRDRWWRAASRGHSWAEQDFLDDPDTASAADWLHGHYLRTYVRAAEDWAEQRHEWPREWIAASDMSDQGLVTTPEGLRALTTELHEVLERHRQQADPGAPGAKQVLVVLQAFPSCGTSDASAADEAGSNASGTEEADPDASGTDEADRMARALMRRNR